MDTANEKIIEFENIENAINIFGHYDENIKIIEDGFDIKIVFRGQEVKILGDEAAIEKGMEVIKRLITQASRGEVITKQNVNYLVQLVNDNEIDKVQDFGEGFICLDDRGKKVNAKTQGQKVYVDSIKKNEIVFGIGPAGTGKTFLAVAMAVNAFRNKEVNKIVLTRPAVEAGEKLGFLPGDLQSKVDPYLRPLYDSLYQLMGAETCLKHLERGLIEVAPLAYMRGRTLDGSFIILDEAQNTTPEQMKMFLTRLGIGSRAVITGDITQIDLPSDKKSGLKEVVKILKDVDGIDFIYLSNRDVVRHELVQKIIKAYEKYDAHQNPFTAKDRKG